MTQVGTIALCFLACTITPHKTHACSVDAGTWAPPAEADFILSEVPLDGALIVHLACTNGPSCPNNRLSAVGDVRAPDGSLVPGTWRNSQGDMVVFTPTSPWNEGTGYTVELKSPTTSQHAFAVVPAIAAPPLSELSARLSLGELLLVGDSDSVYCCNNDSCGSGCYPTRQVELARLALHMEVGALPAQALTQLELTAHDADGDGMETCIGCTDLTIIASQARPSYCAEVSARLLTAGSAVSIGRFCTDAGYAALRTLDTPANEIPSVCAASAGPARPVADAGAAQPVTDAGVGDAGGTSDASPEAPAQGPSASPGCSALPLGQRGTAWLLPLAMFAVLRRRLHRSPG